MHMKLCFPSGSTWVNEWSSGCRVLLHFQRRRVETVGEYFCASRRSRLARLALERTSSQTNHAPETQLLYNQLSHLDPRHFVIIECRHLANGCVLKCGCIGFDVISQSIMSGHNNMLYKYYRNCSGICMQRLWRFGCKLCNHWLTSMRQNGRHALNGRLT